MKDKCVSCNCDTLYETTAPIETRIHYIEGGGQLCEQCYEDIYEHKHVAIPKRFARRYKTDAELGAAVRIMLTQ